MSKYAEILVECAYAIEYVDGTLRTKFIYSRPDGTDIFEIEPCYPFSDTLEGRRQADVIETWLKKNNHWYKNTHLQPILNDKFDYHQWRLEIIRWCVEQLEKDDARTT